MLRKRRLKGHSTSTVSRPRRGGKITLIPIPSFGDIAQSQITTRHRLPPGFVSSDPAPALHSPATCRSQAFPLPLSPLKRIWNVELASHDVIAFVFVKGRTDPHAAGSSAADLSGREGRASSLSRFL